MKYSKYIVIIIIIAAALVVSSVVLGRKAGDAKSSAVVTADITSVKEIGELEVMTASVQVNRQILISNNNKVEYSSLYNVPGTAVYTVNLSKLEIDIVDTADGIRKVLVGIPALDVSLMVHEDELEKIAEYQKGKFTGSAKEGYEKYLSVTKESVAAVEKEIADSEGLRSRAEDSARTQIDMLIRSLSLENCETVLYFL